jgi:hypothetical protein
LTNEYGGIFGKTFCDEIGEHVAELGGLEVVGGDVEVCEEISWRRF